MDEVMQRQTVRDIWIATENDLSPTLNSRVHGTNSADIDREQENDNVKL